MSGSLSKIWKWPARSCFYLLGEYETSDVVLAVVTKIGDDCLELRYLILVGCSGWDWETDTYHLIFSGLRDECMPSLISHNHILPSVHDM